MGAALAVCTLVAGCAELQTLATPASGLWWFASVALLALAAAGYAIGRLTERRQCAAALHDARRQQQALLASLAGAAWRTDAQLRPVPIADAPAGAAQPAAPVAPWAGDPAWGPLLQAHRGFADVKLRAAPRTEETAPSATTPPPAAWLVSGQPLLDAEGRFGGFLGTARKMAEADAAASAAALADRPPTGAAGTAPALSQPLAEAHAPAPTSALAAARAESDEAANFSFTVAHDLRAPIRVVDGFTRIVKEDYGHVLDRVANDHLERVLNAAARMNKMIDALLTLASLSNQPLTQQPVNLSQLARYVVDELQRAQPAREVDVTIEEGLQVMGDPTLLRLVLENLMGNAWKYSARTAQAQISFSAVPHGPGRAFVVRDNGAGFDMRAADRLFGVFQRLHSASEFPGHGVGLASARRIVRRHGGDIWAESEPARGAAFSFTLVEG